jgi:hypothetical protein
MLSWSLVAFLLGYLALGRAGPGCAPQNRAR